jgi:hypothetical protein
MALLNLSGQLSLLRVHDRGTKYGPPADQIDVEVVVQFAGRPNDAFGFQLRDDANGPARDGMLALLRDGFTYGWVVHIDYEITPPRKNGVILRVWLTRPAGHGPVHGPGGVLGRATTAKRTTGASSRKPAAGAARAKRRAAASSAKRRAGGSRTAAKRRKTR